MTFSLDDLETLLHPMSPVASRDLLETLCLPNPTRAVSDWRPVRSQLCADILAAGGRDRVLGYLIENPPEHPKLAYRMIAAHARTEPLTCLTPVTIEDTFALAIGDTPSPDLLRWLWLADADALGRFAQAIPQGPERSDFLHNWRIDGSSQAFGHDLVMKAFLAPFSDESAMIDHVCKLSTANPPDPAPEALELISAWLADRHGQPGLPASMHPRSSTAFRGEATARFLETIRAIDADKLPARAAALLDALHLYKFTRDDKSKFSIASLAAAVATTLWEQRDRIEAGGKFMDLARTGALVYSAGGKVGALPRVTCKVFESPAAAQKSYDKLLHKPLT